MELIKPFTFKNVEIEFETNEETGNVGMYLSFGDNQPEVLIFDHG